MPAFQDLNQAAGLIIPEIILIATVCIMFLAAPFLVTESGRAAAGLRHRWGILALLALGCAALAWLLPPLAPDSLGPFRPDAFAWYVRGVTIITGMLLTLVIWDQTEDGHSAESFACLLAILAGVNFVALANDLVGVFLGLEMVSIPTYILLYLGRSDWMSREATIKYFLLSIFSSALVLYGLTWIFGLAGSTNFVAISTRIDAIGGHPMLLVALALTLAGISFRLTAVPFHFYAPDVFQGVAPAALGDALLPPKTRRICCHSADFPPRPPGRRWFHSVGCLRHPLHRSCCPHHDLRQHHGPAAEKRPATAGLVQYLAWWLYARRRRSLWSSGRCGCRL
ncbi:MAG UNVERIFIED_CONTAM: hypothetical protein LVR18_24060 [Planctomycetaceae bacterium]